MKNVAIGIGAILVLLVLALPLYGRFSKGSQESPEFTDADYERHYKAKEAALEQMLGPMHDLVGHAVVPFHAGGSVDMYYFPNAVPGTGFATMELLEPDGSGPLPNRVGTYELVAFTKEKLPPPGGETKEDLPFNRIERRMCGVLTNIALYSQTEVLNPGDTCEVPGNDDEPVRCIILDEYLKDGKGLKIEGRRYCLLLCIEVFRSEMEYAMENGSDTVLKKLKDAGHYPYSDLNRDPVF